ncbi:MAG: glycosyltransferase [candidate division Zixibacteria bacterium]|nr:glycosyltransferase [candidate division Zixibacteria bacterium]
MNKDDKYRYKGKKIAWVGPFEGEHQYAHMIQKTLESLGVEVIPVDYRIQRSNLTNILLGLDVDALIVNRGEGIDPQIIRSMNCPTLLWYGEYIHGNDQAAILHRQELLYNGSAFDYVIWEGFREELSMSVMRNLGCSNVSYVYPNRIDKDVYRKMKVKKEYDVNFIGSLTPRREEFLNYIMEKTNYEVNFTTTYDIEEQVRIFNESRINLHINFAPYHLETTVNLRVFDVLSCGCFMLSEGVEHDEMFKDGEHLAFFKPGDKDDMVQKIDYYIKNSRERNSIAKQGRKYLHENYSVDDTVLALLDAIDFEGFSRSLRLEEYGIGTDKFGIPSRNFIRMGNACKMILDERYAQHHHMFGFRLFQMGEFEAAIDAYWRALKLLPNNPATLDLLARAYVKIDEIRGAEDIVNKLRAVNPGYPGLSELNQLLAGRGSVNRLEGNQNLTEVHSG